MRSPLISVAFALAVSAATGAQADTINFAQFGAQGTVLPGTLNGVTVGGVNVTLTSPNNFFQAFVEAPHPGGAGTWEGTFPRGAPLLFDGNGSGFVELVFGAPITSLTLAAQANLSGAFVETIQAFNGATLVDTEISGLLFNCANLTCEGTQAFLTVDAATITRVRVSVTNDGGGFALYGGAGANPVPGPIAGAGLPGLVFASAGLLAWWRKRRHPVA
jgi:hypothetical protein